MRKLFDFSEPIQNLKNFTKDVDYALGVIERNLESETNAIRHSLALDDKELYKRIANANDDMKFVFNRQISKLQKELDNLRIK